MISWQVFAINWSKFVTFSRKATKIVKMKHLIVLLLSALILATGATKHAKIEIGIDKEHPATSCNEIYQLNPTSRGTIGQYYIKINHEVKKVTCYMKLKCGGLEGGSRKQSWMFFC